MRIFKGIISTLLAIIVIPIITVFILYLSTRSALSKKGISDLFKQVSLSSVLLDQDGNYNELGIEIKDELVKNGLPEEVIDEFVDSEQITEFFSDYVGDAVGYIIYNDDLDKLTAAEISKLINDNVDDIVDELRERKVEGYEELTDERVAEFKGEIDNLSQEIEKSLPDVKKSIDESDAGTAIEVIRILFSRLMVMIFIVIISIFFLLIALLNLKNFKYGIWLGVICIIAALPYIIFGAVFPSITVNADSKALYELIKFLVSKTEFYAYIFVGVGVLLIILTIIARLIFKKKGNNKTEVEAVDTKVPENKVVGYDQKTGFPIYAGDPAAKDVASTENKIIGYDQNTGFPIYEDKAKEESTPVETVPVEPIQEEVAAVQTEEPVKEEVTSPEENVQEEVTSSTGEVFCSSCGAKMNEGQNFCYNCGTSKK